MNLISTSIVADRILNRLARYRFLTVAQLLDAGAGDEKTVRLRLGGLVTAGHVMRQEFRLGPSAGRLPDVHWLSKSGARLVEQATGETVTAPDGRQLTVAHVWHRSLTVSTLIAADVWARATDQGVPEFRTYMEFSGKLPATSLKLLGKTPNADAILNTHDTAGNRRIYVVEVYCSHYSEGGSMHPLTQLEPYVLTGMTDALDDALGIPPKDEGGKAARVLVVCDHVALRDRIIRNLPKRPGMPPLDKAPDNRTWGRFLFKTPWELKDFGKHWLKVDDTFTDLPT